MLILLQEIEQVHKQDKFHMETLHEKQVKFMSIIHVCMVWKEKFHRSDIGPISSGPDKRVFYMHQNRHNRYIFMHTIFFLTFGSLSFDILINPAKDMHQATTL